MQRPMMPSWYTTWPPESNLILKIVDSMSNESPNKVLQDAHAYYWAKLPYRRRILVCRSSHAAAVHSWTSKSATPSKASWSQFESVNNGWHLKQKPWPSPSIFMYILLPLNEQVIVQQGSEGRKRSPQIIKKNHLEVARRSALEHKLTLITKMSISNYTTINSLHDSHLHLWKSRQNRWEYWASSPKLSPTGAC